MATGAETTAGAALSISQVTDTVCGYVENKPARWWFPLFGFTSTVAGIGTAMILYLIITSTRGRKQLPRRDVPRSCPGCGSIHPPHAHFCRRCGHRVV